MTTYPEDWEEIAHGVKEEAGWRCEGCGHPNSYKMGYSLTVHHLDGDTSNNSRENLKALCQRCHLKRQGRLRLYGPEDDRQLRLPLMDAMTISPPMQRHDPRRMTMIA